MDGKRTAKNLTKLSRCKTLSYELSHEKFLAIQRNNYAHRRVKMRQLRKPKGLPEQQNIGRMRKDLAPSGKQFGCWSCGEGPRAPFVDPHSRTASIPATCVLFVAGQIIGCIQGGIPELLEVPRLQFLFGEG